MRLHSSSIPEGGWGAGGQTIDTEIISKLIGATQGPARLAEARGNAAKIKAARVSWCFSRLASNAPDDV